MVVPRYQQLGSRPELHSLWGTAVSIGVWGYSRCTVMGQRSVCWGLGIFQMHRYGAAQCLLGFGDIPDAPLWGTAVSIGVWGYSRCTVMGQRSVCWGLGIFQMQRSVKLLNKMLWRTWCVATKWWIKKGRRKLKINYICRDHGKYDIISLVKCYC